MNKADVLREKATELGWGLLDEVGVDCQLEFQVVDDEEILVRVSSYEGRDIDDDDRNDADNLVRCWAEENDSVRGVIIEDVYSTEYEVMCVAQDAIQ